MALQGLKIPDNEQIIYRDIKNAKPFISMSELKMKHFVFQGPLEEVIRMLDYIEAKHGEKLTLTKYNEHYARVSVCIHDPKLIQDFPVLKATGFVLDLNSYGYIRSASVVYKESGYAYPMARVFIKDYYTDINPEDVRFRRELPKAWPILKDPTLGFKTWYYEQNSGESNKRVDINYVFPFRKEWNVSEYIFEKEDGFYRFDPNGKYIVENSVLIRSEGLQKSVGIPDEIRVIGQAAFKDNKLINRVTLSRLTEIQDEAFSYCSNLKYIEFKKGLKRIGSEAFANCERLTELIIPDSVVEISPDAFFRCGVEKLVWPKGVKEIPAGMFKECRNLYEITIPPEVKTISRRAFNRANTIIVYGVPGSVAEEYAKNNGMYFKEKDF